MSNLIKKSWTVSNLHVSLAASARTYLFNPHIIFAELAIPANANVYYAVSTQHDLNFILREKHEDFNGPSLNDSTILDSSVAGTPKSGSRKGSRDTSKARRKLMGIHL